MVNFVTEHIRFTQSYFEWRHILHWQINSSHLLVVSDITMTSQWAWWRHRSPASWLFTQPFIRAQIKENIKAPRHWPLCEEFTGDRWILRTNGQLRGKCFHLMTSSWRASLSTSMPAGGNLWYQGYRGVAVGILPSNFTNGDFCVRVVIPASFSCQTPLP